MKITLQILFKQWLQRRSSVAIFLICILITLGFGLMLEKVSNQPITFALSVVDLDKSPNAKVFIDALSKNPLLDVRSTEAKEAQRDFSRGRTLAILEIPAGFFDQLDQEPLLLHYRAYDGAAPALTDLIAQSLMPFIGKIRLEKATARLIGPEWVPTGLKYYRDYLKEHPTEFAANIQEVASQKGLVSSAGLALIQTANQALGYCLLLIILLLVRQQAQEAVLNSAIQQRLKSIPGLWLKMQRTQWLFDLLQTAIPWSLMFIFVGSHLHLKPLVFLSLWFYGLLITQLFKLLLQWLYRISSRSSTSASSGGYAVELVVFGLVIGSALTGGAMFSIDLLPSGFSHFLQWNPFYVYNKGFYDFLTSGYSRSSDIYFFILLLALVTGKIILLLSKNGIKMVK